MTTGHWPRKGEKLPEPGGAERPLLGLCDGPAYARLGRRRNDRYGEAARQTVHSCPQHLGQHTTLIRAEVAVADSALQFTTAARGRE